VSGSYGNSGGRDDPERLPNDPIWGESLLIKYLAPVLTGDAVDLSVACTVLVVLCK
jgi:hypothetical protein